MIIYLVRHGETEYNRDGVGLGRADVPLTLLGAKQAEATAARLGQHPIDAVFSSPLRRALTTARLIATTAGAPLHVDERLVELEVGETEGLPFPVLRERYADVLKRWGGPDGHNVRLPGGESIADLSARVSEFQETLAGSGAQNVAVVSHNFVLRVIFCHLIGLSISEFRRLTVDLSSISVFDWAPERTFVRTLNDRCHLAGLDS